MVGENPEKTTGIVCFFESPYNGKYREILKSSSQYAIHMASTGCQHSMFKVSGLFLPKQNEEEQF